MEVYGSTVIEDIELFKMYQLIAYGVTGIIKASFGKPAIKGLGSTFS